MTENRLKNIAFEQAFIAIAHHTDITGEPQRHIFLVDRNGSGLLVAQLVNEPRPVNLETLAPTSAVLAALPEAIALAKDANALQASADQTSIDGYYKDIEFGLNKLRKLVAEKEIDPSLKSEAEDLIDEAEYVLAHCKTHALVAANYKAFVERYKTLMDVATTTTMNLIRQQTLDKILASAPDATEAEKRALYDLMGVQYPEPAVNECSTEPVTDVGASE